MTDYRHDLMFGTFLTPTADQSHQVVALAQLSEDAGLDLVSVQDHPYQPRFLDTWTLLSYLAARTEHVRLAPNVANLPLRPPAVLARSAASLDLLSGGRVELGLGAGAFWDAIEAMGGARLTAGEAVRAVEQAIEVIRGIWAVADRGTLRVGGEFHRVDGAKRGPAPAHDIGIWLGAYRPRMLALTGRLADGWLPSLGYLQSGDLAAGNQAIDAAAEGAGRPVSAVRRLLNISGDFSGAGSGPLHGPPAQWVDELTTMALEDGVSTFILGSDDPGAISRFGREVAPAVRELVAAEREARPAERDVAAAEHREVAIGTRPLTGSTAATAGPATAAGPGAGTAEPGAGTDQYSRLGLRPTQDDGVRLSEPVWDEHSRPHRADSAAGIVYTDQGRAVGQHLIDVHDHLRAELAQVRDLIDQVRRGAISAARARSGLNQMTMRQNNWTLGAYCVSYCRLVTGHHSLEDQSIFPHLRTQDADLVPVIDRLEAEHLVIHDVLDRVDRALVAFIGHPDDFTELQQAVDMLTDTMRSHLSYEEQQLVEPLARLGFYPGQV